MYSLMTSQRPFSADSPTNLTPINPVLSWANIPTDAYAPAVNCSSYSVPVVVGAWNTVAALVKNVKDQDGEYIDNLTIPHMPVTDGAPGTDGHAVSIDPYAENGVVHQFQGLKRQEDGTYTASAYAYSRLNDTGFGDAQHYRKGTTAIGSSAMNGLILSQDISDGRAEFDYALAMSLTYSGLAKSMVWPATDKDSDVRKNTGIVPYGARLMLSAVPAGMTNTFLKRVAATLVKRGAIVRDRNDGCPFTFYAQQGIDMSLYKADGDWLADMELIRKNLMIATTQAFFLDGNNRIWTPEGQNIISLRGNWRATDGGAAISGLRMDPYSGALSIGGSATATAINYDNRMILPANMPAAGDKLRLRVHVSNPLAVTRFTPQNGTCDITKAGSYTQDIVWGSASRALYFKAVSIPTCQVQVSLVNLSKA